MRNTICILLFVFLCSSFTSVTLAAGPLDAQKLEREINVLRIEMARPNRPEKQLQMLRSHLARVDFQIQSMMKDAANDEQLQKLADSVLKLRGARKPNAIARTPAAPPANDNCENAEAIGDGTISRTTIDATADGTSSCDIESTTDVWFDYQATSTGILSIGTHNSDFYTLISVHSSCPGNESNESGCSALSGNSYESNLFVQATAGVHYKIRVAGYFGDIGDFSLQVAPAGSMSGTITDAQTQAPLDQIEVILFDGNGEDVAATTTDPAGNYTFSILEPGTYYALTRNDQNYIDELYNNIPCWGPCDPITGTPIVVNPDANTAVDMQLARGGSFSGTVTDAATGGGLPDMRVGIFDQNGYIGSVFTNAQGYFVKGGLPTAIFFATAEGGDYIQELYDNLPCPCDPVTGTPISVTIAQETPGIDFTLDRGGIISGTVTDSASGNPLTGFPVLIRDSLGNFIKATDTDFLGHYAAGGLAAGSYYVQTDANFADYRNEIYDNIPCGYYFCDNSGATLVPVTVSNTTSGIDFGLARMGSISGHVTDSLTGAALPNITITVFDSNGNGISNAFSDSAGNFVVDQLLDGTYYALAEGGDNYLNEIYDGVLCTSSCDPTSGLAIPVVISADTPGIDFALDPGGSITGTVTDAAGGAPLRGIGVTIYDQGNNFAGSGYTDYNGRYVVSRLVSGNYHVRTQYAQDLNYIDELYDNIPCLPQCNLGDGNLVAVTLNSNTADIDFGLEKLGSIGGAVTDELTGFPVSNFFVNVYDINGDFIRSASDSDAFGHYVVRDLPAGTYFVTCQAFNSDIEYMQELYNNHPCTGSCDVTSGDPVTVTLSSYTSGIDFSLQRVQQGLFADDFEDGVLDPAWTYDKGTWVESGGFLQGTASKGASTFATPFTGCSSCTVEAVLQSGGGTGNRVWLLGWYQDKANFVELMMKQEAGKWILKQHAGGTIVSKASISMPINANVLYAVKIAFDGSAFSVYIDNVLAFTMPNRAPSVPQGTVGFQLKKTTASFDSILVYD